MKKLNLESTQIFCSILKKLGNQSYLKLLSEGFMPLVIEEVGNNIETVWGKGKLISLAHYYTQEGDPMRDPEMVFIVVDNRQKPTEYQLIGVYPQMYQQDNLGLYEESITIKNNKVTDFIKTWQDGHCSFANMWLRNIKAQGFLD